MPVSTDTIAAIATPPGVGGIAVVRLSGPNALQIARKNSSIKNFKPRFAHYAELTDKNGCAVDAGVWLYFQGPNSYTGEDVVEYQGHGGAAVSQLVLSCFLEAGARLARPGEFTERAFLNGKLDLVQAEAVADLIHASSEAQCRAAQRSLAGEFSRAVHEIVEATIELRAFIEASIDFTEEDIDFLKTPDIALRMENILTRFNNLMKSATEGAVLTEGRKVVLLGEPNVGKSSLLNALAGQDVAIVTAIAGTTRDVVKKEVVVDGLKISLADTAGLQQTDDAVEQEGIKRSWRELEQADCVLLVIDHEKQKETNPFIIYPQWLKNIPSSVPIIVAANKIDCLDITADVLRRERYSVVKLSAQTGQGVQLLKKLITQQMGLQAMGGGAFSARSRHVQALTEAQKHLQNSQDLTQTQQAELMAEELRQMQLQLSSITGEFTADDLLGKIFSDFCIGK